MNSISRSPRAALAAPYTSIQYAIEQGTTVPGDTVLVLPGRDVEQVDFQGKAPALPDRRATPPRAARLP